MNLQTLISVGFATILVACGGAEAPLTADVGASGGANASGSPADASGSDGGPQASGQAVTPEAGPDGQVSGSSGESSSGSATPPPQSGSEQASGSSDSGSVTSDAAPYCVPRTCLSYHLDLGRQLIKPLSDGEPWPAAGVPACGTVSDGCGGTLDCGSCSDPCALIAATANFNFCEIGMAWAKQPLQPYTWQTAFVLEPGKSAQDFVEQQTEGNAEGLGPNGEAVSYAEIIQTPISDNGPPIVCPFYTDNDGSVIGSCFNPTEAQ